MSYPERHSLDSFKVERRKLRGAAAMRLVLPFPPARDQLFAAGGERGRIRTTRYKEWRALAASEILRQQPRCVVGAAEVTVTLEEKAGRRDADQFLDAVLFCLSDNGILTGERSVRRVTVQWGAVKGAVVDIVRLDRAA
jgi:hypothetical protein